MSNDRHAHISKYLKDENAKRLSKRQSSEAQSVNLVKEELSLKRKWMPQKMNFENK